MHLYITINYLSNDTKLDFKGPEVILGGGKESHYKCVERVLCNEFASLTETSIYRWINRPSRGPKGQ